MKTYKPLRTLPCLFIAFALIFSACDVTENNGNGEGIGSFAVHLTDAPGDYDAVFIDIEGIRVKLEADNNGESNEGDEDGWITISDDSVRVNLLDLRNGETIILGEEELEAGTYHQIRLILGDENAVVVDGNTYPLQTPSAQESGLKLNINADVTAGETYVLLIDFNAAKSIVEAGNSGKYILKPVIRTVELGETGSISGIVTPSAFQTSVWAIANGDTLTTYTEDDGGFQFIGVTEGSYDVVFNPLHEAFIDTTITGVEVAVDEDVDLGTITLPQL